MPTIQYGVGPLARLPNPYRGWSVGAYNGGGDQGNQPIPPGALEAAPVFDGSEELSDEETARALAEEFMAKEMSSFGLLPLPDVPPCPYKPEDPIACTPVQDAHWSGPDSQVYVTGHEMGASRLGGLDLTLPNSGELAGARAVPRISKSDNVAVGGGILITSFSGAKGNSQGVLDFVDMNGDGFPDVVSPESVQSTSPRGVLAELISVPTGGIRQTRSDSKTVGIGGNPAKNPFDAWARKGARNASRTDQMARLGFVRSHRSR